MPWVYFTQHFSEVMAVQLPSEAIKTDNATSHLWMRERYTPRFLQAAFIQCFSVVMAVLFLLEATDLDNATSHL